MTQQTRVMIVDDHPMVAQGIQSILETYDDIAVVCTTTNGENAVEQITKINPDVVLMDLNMPGIGGLSATEQIMEQSADTKVVILSMHDSAEYIVTALNHGASGYILKDVETDEIKIAIDAATKGERYLCTGAQAAIASSGQHNREALTSREQTILLELAQGRSNKEVGLALNISVRTVETHRKNIRKKLDITSTAGLTRYALEHGVLQGTGK